MAKAETNTKGKKPSNYQLICSTLESHTKVLEEHTKSIRKMENRVFNGFGTRIDNLEKQVNRDIEESREGRKLIMQTMGSMIKFGASAMILIIAALIGIFGSLWLQDREFQQEMSSAPIYKTVDPKPSK